MSDRLESVWQQIWVPPSDLPIWRWWEENIELDNTSAAPGRYSTEMVPMVRWYCEYKQNPRTRRITMMVSAQSTKTQNGINSVVHDVAEDPGPGMWIMANADHCDGFAARRLFPAIEQCPKTRDLLPKDRNRRNKKLIQFDSMNLMLRGSNSRIGLQSDPVRRTYCDERREWKKGAIDLVRKRTRTFHNHIEVSMGTAGTKEDELHTDYKDGNQVLPHFRCPKCQLSQPWRFGRKPSVLFGADRKKGGCVWDENEVTRPNGKWNEKEVKKTVRFECENPECDKEFRTIDKLSMIRSAHPCEYASGAPAEVKPGELPIPENGFVSMHWGAMPMPWKSCSFEDIVWEFLKACDAYKMGNIEPLKAFVTETLGEPWEERGNKPSEHALKRQCGSNFAMPYVRKELWIPSGGEQIGGVLTADVQAAEGGYIKWLARNWKENADSRLIDYGWCRDYDDLKKIQIDLGIIDDCVFIDSGWGPGTSRTYQACVEYNWRPMKGDDGDYFTVTIDKIPRRIPWRLTDVDPSLGKQGQGRMTLPLLFWKHSTYRDRLLLHIAVGRGPLWLLPDNIGDDYLAEMTANERIAIPQPNGSTIYEWRKLSGRPDDYQDCELMQLVVADAGGIAISGEQAVSQPTAS